MAEELGVVKTCPACRMPIESFQARCLGCGCELNNIKTSETVQAFFQRLETLSDLEYQNDIEREREDKYLKEHAPGTHKKVTFGTIMLWLFFFWILWIPIVIKKAKGPYAKAMVICGVVAVFSLLLIYGELSKSSTASTTLAAAEENTGLDENNEGDTVTQPENKTLPLPMLIAIFALSIIGIAVIFIIMKPKWTPEDKRRQSMIELFPIPNSKEDLTEFIFLATDRIKPVNPVIRVFSLQVKRRFEWNNIWIAKCNQAYKKVRIVMKDDTAGLKIIHEMMAESGLKT